MSYSASNTNFSFEYIISVVVILIVCNLLVKTNPQMNTIIVLIVGLLVGYLSLLIMNSLFPALNSFGTNVYQYAYTSAIGSFNDTGYMNVWPPILAILIIFIILLYNRQLG
jgi:ABC-type Fe3+-siderophore transport system permease subunit